MFFAANTRVEWQKSSGPRSIRIEKVLVKKGKLTVTGELDSAAVAKGSVALQVERTGPLAKPAKKRRHRAGASKAKVPQFKILATTSLAGHAAARLGVTREELLSLVDRNKARS